MRIQLEKLEQMIDSKQNDVSKVQSKIKPVQTTANMKKNALTIKMMKNRVRDLKEACDEFTNI